MHRNGLGWMDGMMLALGSRGMKVVSYATLREIKTGIEWRNLLQM